MQIMSKTIITVAGQTIADIAIQHCGNADRLLDIMNSNTFVTINDMSGVEIDLGYALAPGQQIVLDEDWIDLKITKELNQNIVSAI